MKHHFYPEEVKTAGWERALRAYNNNQASSDRGVGHRPAKDIKENCAPASKRVQEKKVASLTFRSSKKAIPCELVSVS